MSVRPTPPSDSPFSPGGRKGLGDREGRLQPPITLPLHPCGSWLGRIPSRLAEFGNPFLAEGNRLLRDNAAEKGAAAAERGDGRGAAADERVADDVSGPRRAGEHSLE